MTHARRARLMRQRKDQNILRTRKSMDLFMSARDSKRGMQRLLAEIDALPANEPIVDRTLITPNRNAIDQQGLTPDIVVEPSQEAIENNRDETLARAVEYLQTGE